MCEWPEIPLPSQRGHCRGNEKMQKLFNLPDQSLMEHRGGRQTKGGSRGRQNYLMSIGCCQTPTATPDCSLAQEGARSQPHLLKNDDVPGVFFLFSWSVMFYLQFCAASWRWGRCEGSLGRAQLQTPRRPGGFGDGSNTILTKRYFKFYLKLF